MRNIGRLAAIMTGTVLAWSSLAMAAPDPAAVQKAVDSRIAHYKEIGKATKGIEDELGQSRGSPPASSPDHSPDVSSLRLNNG